MQTRNRSVKSRLFYIDNLRIFLISLVVLHHFSITYGAPGGWYYNESQADFPAIILLVMFVATNQSFFMGMFFLISAFFSAASLKRKTTAQFFKARLIRLGIPLLIFFFLLNPLTIYIHHYFIQKENVSIFQLITNPDAWGFGPMWFVEALLIFSLIFILIRPLKIKLKAKFPSTLSILLAALSIGLIQFAIRLKFPVGWSMPFTNFQFPYFIQYIFLFAIGIVAFQNNWFKSISFKKGVRWFVFAQVLILVVLPVVVYFGGEENGTDAFSGGLTWQSFSYSVWEQITGFSLIIGLIGIFRKRYNSQGKVAKQLSNSAYGVFVLHAPLLVALSAFFVDWQIPQIVKLVVLAPIALLTCFSLAWLAKKLPILNKIL
jgi:peptidoglycan/LPS O-acetylase OafA/YrhL